MNVNELKRRGVNVVNFTWVGLDGYVRAKGAYIEHLEDMIKSGIGLTKAMFSFTPMDYISPLGSFGPQDQDVFLVPDVTTLTFTPPYASVICDLYDGDSPWFMDVRSRLRSVLQEVRKEGLEFMSGFEYEFYLVKDRKPFNDARCFDPQGMNEVVITKIVSSLKENGIDVLRVIKEYGPAQYEIDVSHRDSLRASDEFVMVKGIVKSEASNSGLEANFMPKPFNGLAGSGLHLNLSVWKENKNLFFSEGKLLSKFGMHFVGGILKHAKALTAIAAPTVNSYKRLRSGTWAPTKIAYGSNNKSAMIRIPTPYRGNQGNDSRLEYRVSDPSVNPYLVTLAVIAAGMDGVKEEIDPGLPVNENSYFKEDIPEIPRNLREALKELDKDVQLKRAVGERIVREFINVKMAEVEEYESRVTDWEYETYSKI
ncbi:glutamine synthetase family protein [Sulfuracidifex tepidarius]|uniref:Glutamine synthetase n=1 Tax=Sulfuracidifex tepidarius TaxID=1294262 RepID=A0A510E5Y9_9CREN|nr:glutamine synthetase family protein [Sulfuracidifex tepidarius]BBG25160.1 Glutamine synthetase [Sulfuracidifex tepidarius]BBG27951.1 Glutamine synthetase [Sulfuracidifex tepidarius]